MGIFLTLFGIVVLGFLTYRVIWGLEKRTESALYGSKSFFLLLKIIQLYPLGVIVYYEFNYDDALNSLGAFFLLILLWGIEFIMLAVHFLFYLTKYNDKRNE